MAEVRWRVDRPPTHGYYLGAWQRGTPGVWTVSELWFNPDSTGTGWWPDRGYMEGVRDGTTKTIPVEAWAEMPVFTPAMAVEVRGQLHHVEDTRRPRDYEAGALGLRA